MMPECAVGCVDLGNVAEQFLCVWNDFHVFIMLTRYRVENSSSTTYDFSPISDNFTHVASGTCLLLCLLSMLKLFTQWVQKIFELFFYKVPILCSNVLYTYLKVYTFSSCVDQSSSNLKCKFAHPRGIQFDPNEY